MTPSKLVPTQLVKKAAGESWRQANPAWILSLLLGGLAAGSLTGHPAASAHGVVLQQNKAVEVEARFDTGKPLAKAQVAVFAPDEPETPVLTGTTDSNGRFQFVPDPARVGDWSVQVRSAGHGAITTVSVGPAAGVGTGIGTRVERAITDVGTSQKATPSMTAMQRLLMGGCVLWGLIGTTLFFSRRPRVPGHPVNAGHQPNAANSVRRDADTTLASTSPTAPLHSDSHAHS